MSDASATEHMLSTRDNPHNPWTHFEEWLVFDTLAGYHSLSLIGRLVYMVNELTQEDEDRITEEIISEIVEENVSGMHIRVPQPKSVSA